MERAKDKFIQMQQEDAWREKVEFAEREAEFLLSRAPVGRVEKDKHLEQTITPKGVRRVYGKGAPGITPSGSTLQSPRKTSEDFRSEPSRKPDGR